MMVASVVNHLCGLVIVLGVAACSSQARAEILAADDFENVLGTVPTVVTASRPSAGSWVDNMPVLGEDSIAQVLSNGVGPAAQSGQNKMQLTRQFPNALLGFGSFSTSQPYPQVITNSGDKVKVTYWLNQAISAGSFAQMGFMASPGSSVWNPSLTNILEIDNAKFGTQTPYGITYYTEAGGRHPVPGGLSATPNEWEKWVIDYTVGSTSISLSIDGPTQGFRTTTIPNFGRNAPAIPNVVGWHFTTGNTGTVYYVDNVLATVLRTPGPADLNNNGSIGLDDYAILKSHFLQHVSDPSLGDLNNDGLVDLVDFVQFKQDYDEFNGGALELPLSAVPEPSTWGLLIMAASLAVASRFAALS